MKRRELVARGLAGSALLLTPSPLLAGLRRWPEEQSVSRPWLTAALKAETWLAAAAQRDTNGIAWPIDPAKPKSISPDLYNGMAGIVLFHLELHNATGDARALEMARGGADYLLSTLPDEPGNRPMGLYTGLAGTAIVLANTFDATQDRRYEAGVTKILSLIDRAAKPHGLGVEWNDSTDIISGSAGIGLALLSLRRYGRAARVETQALALRAGDRLLELSHEAGMGMRTWLISPQTPRNYPNFSHGTAGVSYFLALLSMVSRYKGHLDAALAGERWLQSIGTETPNGGRMIYHSAPGNEQIFYLSWCHGPAGTARLYRALSTATGNRAWEREIDRLALAARHMNVPDRSPGFWNNVSQCCGNCGVSEFFLGLHRLTGDDGHLAYAETIAHDTLRRATPDGDGLKWIQAEHRVRPELLVAQTGLMQGAAGVGLAMLHLDGARVGRKPFVKLPDDPF